jgi:hypothetical protein
MNKEDLKGYIEHLKESINDNFNKDAFISPTILFLDKDFNIAALPYAIESPEAKELLTKYVIPATIEKHKAEVVITISEAWMKEFNKNEKFGDKEIHDYNDKVEVVILSIETFDEVEVHVYEIKRPENKVPYLEFKTSKIDKYPNIQGQFVNFLRMSKVKWN